jgi:hypothetical protein
MHGMQQFAAHQHTAEPRQHTAGTLQCMACSSLRHISTPPDAGCTYSRPLGSARVKKHQHTGTLQESCNTWHAAYCRRAAIHGMQRTAGKMHSVACRKSRHISTLPSHSTVAV